MSKLLGLIAALVTVFSYWFMWTGLMETWGAPSELFVMFNVMIVSAVVAKVLLEWPD